MQTPRKREEPIAECRALTRLCAADCVLRDPIVCCVQNEGARRGVKIHFVALEPVINLF